MHYYIYYYRNKINGHGYIGQTNNIQRRMNEHHSRALNPKSNSYNVLFYRKIREYGEENFEHTILEEGEAQTQEEVNLREQYWIKEKQTYCGWGKGYNMNLGGDALAIESKVLSSEQLLDVKKLIKEGTPYSEIENKFHISPTFISNINHGVYFFDVKEKYPLYKYYKTDDEYKILIDLLKNSTYSLSQIAQMLKIGYSTVKKINQGKLWKGLSPQYPIRDGTVLKIRADKIKEFLIDSNYSFTQISKMLNVSQEVIRRINLGHTFFDKSLSYPLRSCNDYSREGK